MVKEATNNWEFGIHWEAKQWTWSDMLTLYRTLIRSKLDYGSIVYHSARKSYLQLLDPIANHALRLCWEYFAPLQSAFFRYWLMNHPYTFAENNCQYNMLSSCKQILPIPHITPFTITNLHLSSSASPGLFPFLLMNICCIALHKLNKYYYCTHCILPKPPWTLCHPTVLFDVAKNK